MNRRLFMRTMFGVTITLVIEPTIIIPTRSVQAKLGLHGIPYHQSNASTGSWLGFDRALYSEAQGRGKNISKEVIALIRKIMIDNNEANRRILDKAFYED